MNVKLGKYNQLKVVKEVDFGVYLDGDDDGEILLPARYVPDGCKPDDVLNVFIYLDNEERLGLIAKWENLFKQNKEYIVKKRQYKNKYFGKKVAN